MLEIKKPCLKHGFFVKNYRLLLLFGVRQITSFFTMLFFGLGVSVVLLSLSYGTRELLTKRKDRLMKWMPWAKPIMGVVMIIVGIGLLLGWNHTIDQWLLDIMPVWLQDLSVSV